LHSGCSAQGWLFRERFSTVHSGSAHHRGGPKKKWSNTFVAIVVTCMILLRGIPAEMSTQLLGSETCLAIGSALFAGRKNGDSHRKTEVCFDNAVRQA